MPPAPLAPQPRRLRTLLGQAQRGAQLLPGLAHDQRAVEARELLQPGGGGVGCGCVSMDGWVGGWLGGWVRVWMDGWLGGRVYVRCRPALAPAGNRRALAARLWPHRLRPRRCPTCWHRAPSLSLSASARLLLTSCTASPASLPSSRPRSWSTACAAQHGAAGGVSSGSGAAAGAQHKPPAPPWAQLLLLLRGPRALSPHAPHSPPTPPPAPCARTRSSPSSMAPLLSRS
jgi:hypothetical protein